MIVPELVRWHAAMWADPSRGIDAVAPSVPRGSDPLPPAVVVHNAIDEDWLARGAPIDPASLDPATWVFTVAFGQDMQLAGDLLRGAVDDEAIIVATLTGLPDNGADAAALAAAYRLMRVARRCLVDAWRPYAQTGLELEAQRFRAPTSMRVALIDLDTDAESKVALTMVLPYPATDPWALSPIP